MKKLKTILPILLAVFSITIFLVFKSLKRVEKIGQKLIKIEAIEDFRSNHNSPVDGIVNIGRNLYYLLKNNSVPRSELEVKSSIFDCFDNSWFISPSIQIKSPNSSLCIRLKYDFQLDKYHIIGFYGNLE